MNPPARPEEGKGYFEYVEGGDWRNQVTQSTTSGSVWVPTSPTSIYWSTDLPAYNSVSGLSDPVGLASGSPPATASTVGERGDILMLTTRNSARPFTGRMAWIDVTGSGKPATGGVPVNGVAMPKFVQGTIQSDVAEVAWFVRGHTLHRRVLMVSPGASFLGQYVPAGSSKFVPCTSAAAAGLVATWGQTDYNAAWNFFLNTYALSDVSVRMVNTGTAANKKFLLVPNSLGDLTKRENRYAHPTDQFPFERPPLGAVGLADPPGVRYGEPRRDHRSRRLDRQRVGSVGRRQHARATAIAHGRDQYTDFVGLPRIIRKCRAFGRSLAEHL